MIGRRLSVLSAAACVVAVSAVPAAARPTRVNPLLAGRLTPSLATETCPRELAGAPIPDGSLTRARVRLPAPCAS
jgi:hypothetical protein